MLLTSTAFRPRALRRNSSILPGVPTTMSAPVSRKRTISFWLDDSWPETRSKGGGYSGAGGGGGVTGREGGWSDSGGGDDEGGDTKEGCESRNKEKIEWI